jgi:hypothetical protein
MIHRAPLVALVLSLAAAACSGSDALGVSVDPQPVQGVSGDAAQQRALWDAQDVDDYRFAYHRVCFCMQRGTVQVTVRDGRVTDVRQVGSGWPVPRDAWGEFLTVDALFQEIAEAQARGEYTAATYHPTLGYPVEADVGTLANDAGVRHILSGLKPID